MVPKGIEKIIQRRISLLLRKEEKKGLKKDILKKYLGKFSGSIDEEEWYFQWSKSSLIPPFLLKD